MKKKRYKGKEESTTDWTDDPEIQEFLENIDESGPWSEEDDKIFTIGGLTADKDGDFMKFQNKIKKREERNVEED